MKFFRIVVFVPADHFEDYMNAVQDYIPSIGEDYDRVAWWGEPKAEHGTEQFRPLSGSHPAQGQMNETVRKPSMRLEISHPYDRKAAEIFVREVLIKHHIWNDPIVQIFEGEIILK